MKTFGQVIKIKQKTTSWRHKQPHRSEHLLFGTQQRRLVGLAVRRPHTAVQADNAFQTAAVGAGPCRLSATIEQLAFGQKLTKVTNCIGIND